MENKPESEAKQALIRKSIASRLSSKKLKKIMLFSRILTRALIEAQHSDLYPEHTVEQALLAYFWKKAQNNDDKQALLKALGPNICAPKQANASEAASFSNKTYFELAKQFKENPEAAPQSIFSNPELTAFVGYGWWAYKNAYPPLSEYTTAIFKGQDYTNCGANTIRNFFNIFCYDAKEKFFNIDKFSKNVEKKKGQISQKVIDYYKKYPTPSLHHSKKSINDWSDIICDLSNITYLKTPAGFNQPACEMDAGVSNTIRTLTHLINSKKITDIAKSNKKAEEKSADTLTEMMKLFSNKEKTWEWSIDDGKKIRKETEIFINFSYDDDSIFDYHFDDDHFYIEYSERNNNKKWNAKAFEHAEKMNLSTPSLLSNFFFYHKPLNWLKKQRDLTVKQQSAALFSANLYSTEKLPKYIDCILKNKLTAFYPLFNSWVAKLPHEDIQMRHKLYKVFKNHPDAIPPVIATPTSEINFIEDLCVAIKAKDIAQVKHLLTSYPHTPKLLNTPNLKYETALNIAIRTKSHKSITALHQLGKLEFDHQVDYYHPLIFATSCGNVKIIQHIIKTWEMNHEQVLSLCEHEEKTLLHTCVDSDAVAALKFFIKIYDLKCKYIMNRDQYGETLLDLARRYKSFKCLV